MEEWRDIEGYEGLYQVSNEGRVKSVGRVIVRSNGRRQIIRERILAPATNCFGYKYVNLRTQGVGGKSITIHRLVAKAFVPNPNNLPEVNHKDECKENNSADNLEWCDRKYNVNYGTAQARHSVTASDSFKRTGYYQQILEGFLWKAVAKCGTDGNEIERYKSIKEASEKTGVFQGDISRCCKGIRKTCGGFKWMYI